MKTTLPDYSFYSFTCQLDGHLQGEKGVGARSLVVPRTTCQFAGHLQGEKGVGARSLVVPLTTCRSQNSLPERVHTEWKKNKGRPLVQHSTVIPEFMQFREKNLNSTTAIPTFIFHLLTIVRSLKTFEK
jgi:hypothetical protein